MAHHGERHYSHRGGWIRAAVLGANDGLLSTSALLVGVAAGGGERSTLITTGLASLAAGAMSMAAGEYGSVASQLDAERSDLDRERRELIEHPERELEELVNIQISRGLSPETARAVASELTANDALLAHARDELGLDPEELAKPAEAAFTSAVSFAVGAAIPVLAAVAVNGDGGVVAIIVVALIGLIVLGALGAKLGGAPPLRAAIRIVVLGITALVVTHFVGALTGASV